MGRLLEALRAESEKRLETERRCESANVANVPPVEHPRFADSQDSQGSVALQSGRLLAALRRGWLPDEWMGLDHGSLTDFAELDDAALDAYVRCLRDSDLHERGKQSPDETKPALCRHCGPIWLAPEVAAVAPKLDGWPIVLGCPWCHVKNRRAIPRPAMTCGNCRHFERDAINPEAGMGRCTIGVETKSLPFPSAKRECHQFQPRGTEP